MTVCPRFEASQKVGDSKAALDSLRRFYDQRFALSDDSYVDSIVN